MSPLFNTFVMPHAHTFVRLAPGNDFIVVYKRASTCVAPAPSSRWRCRAAQPRQVPRLPAPRPPTRGSCWPPC